jgi:hypothetical protein
MIKEGFNLLRRSNMLIEKSKQKFSRAPEVHHIVNKYYLSLPVHSLGFFLFFL